MSARYFSSVLVGQVLLGKVEAEKVAEREGAIIQSDCAAAAPSARWRIALDFSPVTMLTSAGLGAIISLHKLCKAQGGTLAVFGLRDELLELMKITHMHKFLAIADSKESALQLAAG
jgi:anti-anti-sigma factor